MDLELYEFFKKPMKLPMYETTLNVGDKVSFKFNESVLSELAKSYRPAAKWSNIVFNGVVCQEQCLVDKERDPIDKRYKSVYIGDANPELKGDERYVPIVDNLFEQVIGE